mmetsp:Transcript_63548/g.206489  ORF Transcript_63548/g.206489 Transcript_63548/m.206489 type:complete len:292 (-) Transcript_63548:841-1716(-)
MILLLNSEGARSEAGTGNGAGDFAASSAAVVVAASDRAAAGASCPMNLRAVEQTQNWHSDKDRSCCKVLDDILLLWWTLPTLMLSSANSSPWHRHPASPSSAHRHPLTSPHDLQVLRPPATSFHSCPPPAAISTQGLPMRELHHPATFSHGPALPASSWPWPHHLASSSHRRHHVTSSRDSQLLLAPATALRSLPLPAGTSVRMLRHQAPAYPHLPHGARVLPCASPTVRLRPPRQTHLRFQKPRHVRVHFRGRGGSRRCCTNHRQRFPMALTSLSTPRSTAARSLNLPPS